MTHRKFDVCSDPITIFGNLTSNNTTIQNIHGLNNGAMNYAAFAPAAVQISSANTADAAAGTGARAVIVAGLGPMLCKQIEVIATNGQTAVAGTKVFTRVFSIDVISAGTGLTNAGIVYCSPAGTALTSGVPAAASTWVLMPAATGFACNGLVTIPANRQGSVTRVTFTNTAQIAEVSIWAQTNGALSQLFFARMPAAGPALTITKVATDLPPGADIYMRARAATSGAIFSGMMVVRL